MFTVDELSTVDRAIGAVLGVSNHSTIDCRTETDGHNVNGTVACATSPGPNGVQPALCPFGNVSVVCA